MAEPVFVLFGVGIVALGVGLIVKQRRRTRKAAGFEAGEPAPIEDLWVGDGPVQVEGRVRQVGPNLLAAPIDGRSEGVVVDTNVREYRRDGPGSAGRAQFGHLRGGSPGDQPRPDVPGVRRQPRSGARRAAGVPPGLAGTR